ncbi:MAG TPA: lamin tail domain-containing protein, partial [Candidatus Saccharimonadales bacterium]|nr:lamin tail domain-containing protein [Candidatus Saccharimonadales bacterium]
MNYLRKFDFAWSFERKRGMGFRWMVHLFVGALLLISKQSLASGPFVISEFMAVNNTVLNDEDGQNSDWIEIHNEGVTNASLKGWFLTDSTNNLAQWQFPETNVAPSGYLVVFASGKDRRSPGAPLHTNFKLSSGGEYLALVAPDGAVASDFAPAFPPQIADVSYGMVRDLSPVTLVSNGAPMRAAVPPDSEWGLDWSALGYNDSAWTNGLSGMGYDRQPIGVNFLPFIGLNVVAMMYNSNQTIYGRLPFVVQNPEQLVGLTLRMRFEDGFIAYLNGQEVARSNAPVNATWNSGALGPRTDTAATNFVDFDITAFRGSLLLGSNVLAFHALNNPVNSPDLLLAPQLIGTTANGSPQPRYFPIPTPGRANNPGVATLGPIISSATFSPALPLDSDNIVVTAKLRQSFSAVSSAVLHYRVMFASEVAVPMFDDGANGDAAAGDGIYGASIPASASIPGQMVRWYITATDTTGTNMSRFPAFSSADSAAYFGTVIQNPALTNALPVLHWFVQNVPATDTISGTRASVFWNGEFYDNIFCRVRGASAPSFPKKPYKFDFNPGDHFRFLDGQPRVEEINLNTTYQDKAYVRAPLAFETYRNAGVPACDAFPMRIQQNGNFYSVANMTEQLDETFLERRNLDPNGALYKVYNGMDSATTGIEKKTRQTENNNDLQQLIAAVSASNPARGTAIFDVLDMPEIINYLAAGTVAQDWDRIVKNIYVYRDTDGTGLWQMFPWDKDLTFGKAGLVNDTVTATRDSTAPAGGGEPYFSHPFYGTPERNCCGMNHLFDAIYKTPATRQMYLRRLRTVMDQLLQAPGTAPNQRLYEARVDQLVTALQADATLDLAKWGTTYGVEQNLATAVAALKTDYLAPRRIHLYQTHSEDNVGSYPAAAGIPHAQTGSPVLQFGAVEFNPPPGNQAQEYVEMLNPNPIAVDISGWRVTGGIDFTFAAGTVIPANSHLYLSPNLAAFRARTTGPRGGQGLFAVGNYRGQLSARGETLQLIDTQGNPVSSVSYTGAPSLAQGFLRVTEIMYHPAPLTGGTNSAENFEYLELKNISPDIGLDLQGVRLTNGVNFSFSGSAITSLAPGARMLVVRNASAFAVRYGSGLPIAGEYTGELSNNGARLQLLDASGEEVLDFTYQDSWYPVTDGPGFSLVIVNENAPPEMWNNKASWRPSGTVLGSPGMADSFLPAFPPILINELLSRTDTPPPTDSVELYNPTATNVNIGGWFLSDDLSVPKKFRVPDGIVIPAGGYRVFSELDYNPSPGVGTSFSFSSLGEEAWLFSGNAQTNLTGYAHGFAFGAAENMVSFGRYVNSVGEEQFVAQAAQTLTALNSPPRVGPIVISEIMFQPPPLGTNDNSRDEYIELQNVSPNPVPLFQATVPTETWRLRGAVDFDFPTNITLLPGANLLLVHFDPVSDAASLTAFRNTYRVSPGLLILGPYSGMLGNTGERIELYKPDVPVAGQTPFILVEAISYRSAAPWPAGAAGTGSSLQRLVASAYGNDPTNWFVAGVSPGLPNTVNNPPSVNITSPISGANFHSPADIIINAEAIDSDGTIARVEFFADNQKLGETTVSPFGFTWSNAPFGTHSLTAKATDDRLATAVSTPVSVTILAPPPIVSITSPTNAATLLAGSTIPLTAAATDADGFITNVEFFSEAIKIGEVSTSPYVLSW